MKRNKRITLKEAREVWAKIGNNEFTLIHFPTFEDYWKECEEINSLPEEQFQERLQKTKDNLTLITKTIKE